MRLSLVIVAATLAWAGVELHGQCAGPIYPGSGRAFTQDGLDMATADLNGDGFVDVVAVSHDWQQDLPLTVFINDGYGGMSIAGTLQAGEEAHSVVVGDLDGDGDNDLVVSNTGDGDISVFLNHGDATFAEEIRYEVGVEPWKAALGDFDEDGDLDIAAAHFDGVVILSNSGTGAFSASQDLLLEGDLAWGINWIDAGDVDGDGDIDLVVVDFPSAGDATTLLNNGGTFSAAGSYDTLHFNLRMLQLADVDGDADLDTIAVDHDRGVTLLRNQGDGAFDEAEWLIFESGVRRVDVGDLDADGDPDIVASGSRAGAYLLRNEGDLGFQTETIDYPGLYSTESVELVDIEQDGDLDLALVTLQDHDESALVLLVNRGVGEFAARGGYEVENWLDRMAAGDVDGDGWLDLIVSRSGIASSLLSNKGDGTFAEAVQYEVDSTRSGPWLIDLDEDGDADLVTNGANGLIEVHESIGGMFADPIALPGIVTVQNALFANLDHDSDLDLVVHNAFGKLHIFENVGMGNFVERTEIDIGSNDDSFSAGDVDGDDDLDIVALKATEPATLIVHLNEGSFLFQTLPVSFAVGSDPSRVVLGDVDGDGDADAALADTRWSHLMLLLATGDGGFEPVVYLPTVRNTESVATHDVNMDGLTDLVALGSYSVAMQILESQGDGVFDASHRYLTGPVLTEALGADFDGNGYDDLAVLVADPSLTYPHHVVVLLAECPDECVGDVNGDGETGQADLGLLLASYELLPDDPLFEPRADLDGDGEVGQADLGILLADYECGVERGN
jgi:FG-GAP-like repeat